MPPIVDMDADSVPVEEIAPTLIQLASLQTKLAARLIASRPTDTAPTTQAHPERLLTVVEVADMLQLAQGHVYELVRSGAIRAVHHGKYWRITREAVDEFIRANEGAPARRVRMRRVK